MKTLIIVFLLALVPLFGFSQIIIQSEDFDGDMIPTDWNTNIISGMADWSFGSNNMPGAGADFTTNAAIFNDQAAGNGGGNNIAELLSPVIDISNLVSGTLSFDYALQDFAGAGFIRVEAWNGTSWQLIFSAQNMDIDPVNSGDIDILPYANNAFQVKFIWNDENGGVNWGAGIDNFLLRGSDGSFPFPFCGPLAAGTAVEPITRVNISNINNITDATVDGSEAHEDYTSLVASLEIGEFYTVTLEGNTAGDFENRFVLFFDWNRNGILNDAGEVYEVAQTITNSTGEDGIAAMTEIEVSTSTPGDARMRVKKILDTSENYLDPCTDTANGQIEDYTVSLIITAGVGESVFDRFRLYPNPASDQIMLKASDEIEIIAVYNILGQKIMETKINANDYLLSLVQLNSGVYLFKVTIASQTETFRIIKK